MIQKTNLAEPQISIAYFFMGTGWYLVKFWFKFRFLSSSFSKFKKKLPLDPGWQHHKLMWINSMWIKGHYLKFIQYIFLSRTILLKKYFQTEQYFSFCHRKQKKQKNSREISTIAICPSWSFWLGIIKDLTCLFTDGIMCFPIHIVYHEPVTNWCDIFDRLHCWYL